MKKTQSNFAMAACRGLVALICAVPFCLAASPGTAQTAVCDGAPEAPALGIDPPFPPQAYALPTTGNLVAVSTTAQLQEVLAWNSGNNDIQLDIILVDGVYQPDDPDDGFSERGITVWQPATAPDLATPAVLADLKVTGDPTSQPLASKVGIWLAATGSLERAHVRYMHRAGVLTGGNLHSGLVRDIDVDHIGDATQAGTGIYLDNTTVATQVTEFCVGRNTRYGMRSEWDNYKAGEPFDPAVMFPRGINNIVSQGLFEATFIGVWFDQGTIDSHVRSCVFRNYTWAALGFNHNLADLADWPNDALSQGSWEGGNVFSEPDACAVVRDQHPNNTGDPICE